MNGKIFTTGRQSFTIRFTIIKEIFIIKPTQLSPNKKTYAVASGHILTSRAAADILQQGGNAYDAVLAAMLMSFVAEPLLSSPGGGGFMLAASADQSPVSFNFFPNTPIVNPADLSPEALDFYPIHGDFGDKTQEFHIGASATTVPTAIAGIYAIHKNLATLPLPTIAQAAIKAAEDGVIVNQQQAYIADILRPITDANTMSKRFFGGMSIGKTWKNQPLANFINSLAHESHDWFYRGDIAQHIAENPKTVLSRADFEQYQVEQTKPLQQQFKQHLIFTSPQPSTGGSFILDLLREAEQSTEQQSADLCRLSAMQSVDQKILAAEVSRGTTHISVADCEGNLAALTLSNGEGNGMVVNPHGFMLNNFLGEQDINPRGFFAWRQGEQMKSMMAPTIVRSEKAQYALGTGGSNRIKTTMFQVIHRLCNGESLKQAINAPRIHHEHQHTDVEPGFPPQLLQQLSSDHTLWQQANLYFGGVNAVKFGHHCLGYADFRRHGCGITGQLA